MPSGPDGRRERWVAHREARRAELVTAAIDAVTRLGPGVGMEDIAAEAGVTKPVIYRHFTDRADLHGAVGQRAAAELLAGMSRELTQVRHPRVTLAAALDAYLTVVQTQPNLYRFVVRRPSSDQPAATDVAHDYQGLIAAAITQTMGEWLRAAGMDPGGAEPWAHGVVGHVRAVGEWWMDHPAMRRADLTNHLTDHLWGGLESLYTQALRSDGVPLRLLTQRLPQQADGSPRAMVVSPGATSGASSDYPPRTPSG